jgi:hypothetical protein
MSSHRSSAVQASSENLVDAAAQRAAGFLRDSISATGSIQEPLGRDRIDPIQFLTRIENFCDIWHTVTALLTFQQCGWNPTAPSGFLISQTLATGGLSHTSTRPGLCIETTAAATLAVPELRDGFCAVLRRSALSGGRWANFILDQPGGYDLYMCGPSATGWTLAALGADDPLAPAAQQYLLETRGSSGVWQAHDFAYGTPFYPTHVCTKWLPNADKVLDYIIETVGPSGAWGFGDPPVGPPSVVPTALALLTVLSVEPTLERTRRVVLDATRWLMQVQNADGSFPTIGAPPAIWYLGPTFATSLAAQALAGLATTCAAKA